MGGGVEVGDVDDWCGMSPRTQVSFLEVSMLVICKHSFIHFHKAPAWARAETIVCMYVCMFVSMYARKNKACFVEALLLLLLLICKCCSCCCCKASSYPPHLPTYILPLYLPYLLSLQDTCLSATCINVWRKKHRALLLVQLQYIVKERDKEIIRKESTKKRTGLRDLKLGPFSSYTRVSTLNNRGANVLQYVLIQYSTYGYL